MAKARPSKERVPSSVMGLERDALTLADAAITRPAVIMFQPTSFKVVPEGRLKEWETLLQVRVGLRGRFGAGTGTGTVSCCPDCDDCDQD